MLSLLAGYLCCLCAFEWTHLWSFSPLLFRPAPALVSSLSFLFCLGLHGMERARRPSTGLVALCWVAVTLWPLKTSSVAVTLWFSAMSLGLLVCASSGPRAVFGLLLALLLGLSLLSGVGSGPVTVALFLLTGLEAALDRRWFSSAQTTGQQARKRLAADANTRSMEVAWKGLASLFQAAVPGEGERFTTRLLDDTAKVIEGCGGRRVKGSDLSGTYRFPNQQALDLCCAQLQRYEDSIRQVLTEIGAPPLTLVVERKDAPNS